MKNIKKLFVLLLLLVLVPLTVYADEEVTATEEKDPINIYLFRGEGCPHCADLEEFFDKIDKEYGKYYKLIDYEVWYDKDNNDLMQEIADKMGDTVSGVPYLIIGHKSWNGYEDDKQLNKEITDAIMEEYNAETRYDVFADQDKKGNAGAIILVVCIVAAGVGLLLLSRKSTENVNDVPVEEEEELKVEKVVEEKKEEVKVAKEEAPKKTASKKKPAKKKSKKK